jgi:cytochrome c-type biogenesis protein CcmF
VVGGHTIEYVRLEERALAEKDETRALVLIDGAGPYAPAIAKFRFATQLIGTPSVRSTPLADVQLVLVSVGEADGDPVTLRVVVQPLVVWLWIGGGVMALGTLLAAWPSGARRRTAEALEDVVSSSPDAQEVTARG